MSFDMEFAWRRPEKAQPLEAFLAYFRKRPFYTVPEPSSASGGQGSRTVYYENPYTGVYFFFHAGRDIEAELREEVEWLSGLVKYGQITPEALEQARQENEALLAYRWAPIYFVVNYARPYTFYLEADVELQALVEHFDLLVLSYEAAAVPPVPLPHEYRSEWFLGIWGYGQGWTARAFACVAGADGQPFIVQDVEAVWRWNYAVSRKALASGQVFVPRIRYINYGGQLYTATVWRPGPMLLPQAAWVIAAPADVGEPEALEQALAGQEVRLLPWQEVAPLLPASAWRTGPVPAYWLEDPLLIERLENRFRYAPQPSGSLAIKSVGQVHWGC